MPCVAATHAAISGSRRRPWSVYALPPKRGPPPSLASAARAMDDSPESPATSVAVIPRARARSQLTRSRESATMRDSSSGVTPRGYPSCATSPPRTRRPRGHPRCQRVLAPAPFPSTARHLAERTGSARERGVQSAASGSFGERTSGRADGRTEGQTEGRVDAPAHSVESSDCPQSMGFVRFGDFVTSEHGGCSSNTTH